MIEASALLGLGTQHAAARLSPELPTDKVLIYRLKSRGARNLSIDLSTATPVGGVFHNLSKYLVSDSPIVRRLPERQPSREPFSTLTFAVLTDQEGRR